MNSAPAVIFLLSLSTSKSISTAPGLHPQPITKEIRQWLFFDSKDNENDLLQKQLKKAAKDLDLEGAAKLRSLLKKIT